MKGILVFVTLSISLLLGGCKNFTLTGVDGNQYSMDQAAVMFVTDFNNLNGIYPNIKLVKADSWRPGWIVVDARGCLGPILCTGGSYYAVNLNNYQPGQPLSPNPGDYEYVDVQSLGDGNYMDYDGNLYSEAGEQTKDMETLAANIESLSAENLADVFTTSFGMSEDRSLEVAKLTKAYEKISSKRSLTDSEKNHFSKEIFGASYKEALNAVKEKVGGNASSYQDLMEKAAEKNGVSPEAISSVVEGLLL